MLRRIAVSASIMKVYFTIRLTPLSLAFLKSKSMRNQILLVVFILCCSVYCSAQGLYIKFGGGYALPLSTQTFYTPVTSTFEPNNQVNVPTTKTIKGSYGAGTYINGAVGYKFSPFIGFDLNVSYHLGREFTAKSSYEYSREDITTITDKSSSKGIYIAPAFLFMAGTESVRPYALIGVVVGSSKINHENQYFIKYGGEVAEYVTKEESTGELSFGFKGGVGVDFNINNKFSVFVETIFTSMSYYQKEKVVTAATVNDQDILDDFTVNQKKTIYKDEIIIPQFGEGGPIEDPDKPHEELRAPLPLSSLAFNVGVKVKLGSD